MSKDKLIGLRIHQIAKKRTQKLNSQTFTFKKTKKMTDRRKEFFYLELFSMLDAGLDLKKALDIFINQQSDEFERHLFNQIRTSLIHGKSLSESMKISEVFTPYEFYCVQIGEESGQQHKVLAGLAQYFNNKVKIKSQLIKSLSYPLVILIASVAAISFMLAFIVPMFTDIFKRFNGELPMLTRFFISLSSALGNYLYYILLAAILLVVVFRNLLRKKDFNRQLQFFYLKVPYLGKLLLSIYNARFCSSMSLLVGAKVPLVNSIQLVNKMVDFYPIQVVMDAVEKDILKGQTFHDSLSKHKLFDEKTLSMIRIGEEVNKLEVFFEKLHQRFVDDVDVKTNALNTFLEPLIIMILGIVIGLILVAMYLPMFKLSTSMGV